VRQVSRPSRVVVLVAAVLVHGNRALYFLSAAARRAAAIAPALHLVEMADSCCRAGDKPHGRELSLPRSPGRNEVVHVGQMRGWKWKNSLRD
jgi:hypothetical protein